MDVIDILSELVKINSVNPEWGGPGEGRIAKWVRTYLEDEGLEVSETEVLPGRPNIIAKIAGKNPGKRLVLETHMDTVATAGMTIDPFAPEIREGRLYGRGSVDVKAGLAAMMHAITNLKETPECEVWFAAVADEEHAYRGVLSLIDELPELPSGERASAVVAEPTENRVVRANKGVLRWKVRTQGEAAHSAKPWLGKSAILEMAKVLGRIEADELRLDKNPHPLLGPATCSVGLIQGGSQVNVVAEHCEISLDRRLLPGEEGAAVLEEYRGLLSGLDFEMDLPELCDEAMETPADASIVRTASEVLSAMGGDPEPCGVPFGCDVTKLSRAGIPGIIFGPGSIDQAHASVEYVETSQVEFAAVFYGELIARFQGG